MSDVKDVEAPWRILRATHGFLGGSLAFRGIEGQRALNWLIRRARRGPPGMTSVPAFAERRQKKFSSR